jgi:type VI secretion system secreted protein VgrG
VGNGWYIVNAPNNPAHDVRITEKAPPPLEAPDALPPLPGELPPPKTENPPAGAAPDPNVDGGAPVESKTPPDPDKVVTGLGEEVDKIVNQSPTLQKHIRELQARGWKIEFGSAGVGGIGKDDDVIFIDPSLKKRPDQMAAVLAHEVGHARHPVADVPREGLSREEYMRRRVDAYLDSEGAAALETVRYQEEVRANGGNLDIAGFHDDAYREIYDQLQSGQVTEQEAMHRMGQVYGDGELHGDSRVTYRDHFIQAAEKDWNDA